MTRAEAYEWFLDILRRAGYCGAPQIGAFAEFVERLKNLGVKVIG